MKEPLLSREEFKEIYSKVPRLCVEVVIKTHGGVVLGLRKLPSWQGMWHFPGGALDYNETIAEAVERIAKDEIGVSVTMDKLLGYIEYPSEKKERGFGWSVSLAILCRPESEEFRPDNFNSSEIKVFSELPENMVVEQKEFLIKEKVLQ